MTKQRMATSTAVDTRIAYGVACTWWDSINKVGSTKTHSAHAEINKMKVALPGMRSTTHGDHDLPCCPHCGSMLYEVENDSIWWTGVDDYARSHPGYRQFVEWLRGKCYPSSDHAMAAYQIETGRTVDL